MKGLLLSFSWCLWGEYVSHIQPKLMPNRQTQTYMKITETGSLHHCCTMRSNTLLTFRSESRPKSVSTNGAVGGLRGRSPEVSDSSQSVGSKLAGARLFREVAAEGSGEEQREGGGGGWATFVGAVVGGDGGSSRSKEEHSGEDRKLSSFG